MKDGLVVRRHLWAFKPNAPVPAECDHRRAAMGVFRLLFNFYCSAWATMRRCWATW
jgi:hypothetical protein